ncbi:MAG TPA: hypothetical protein VIK11_00475 [Tepidiformaceae bacterium]
MRICRKTLILPLLGALAAICMALPAGLAAADQSPDTLVTGVISPHVAGQTVGVTVGGVACAKPVLPSGAPNGVTDASGAYQMLLHNCQRGTATLTVNGSSTSAIFELWPGVPSTNINATVGGTHCPSFCAYVPQLVRDNP